MNTLLTTPLGWAWCLGLAGIAALTLARRRRHRGARLALAGGIASWLVLAAFSSPLVASQLDLMVAGIGLRWPPRPAWADREPPQAIAVLAGGLDGAPSPRARLSESSLRRLHRALLAARRWPDALVVFSGGSQRSVEATAAGRMAAEAIRLGLEPERVIVEPRATDTRTNAIEIARILRERGVERVALVTSAVHMARARACLAHEGFLARAVSVPPPRRGPFKAGHLLPDVTALRRSGGAIHELFGLLYYRLRGWID